MTTAIIVAMDPTGIIAVGGKIPWHHKADFKRFKNVTMGGALLMGFTTWESLPKPLPGRQAVVVTKKTTPEAYSKHPAGSCSYHAGIDSALLEARHSENVWVAGGAAVYESFLHDYAGDLDFLDVTFVPTVDVTPGSFVTRFPIKLLSGYRVTNEEINFEDPLLVHRRYER